MPPQPHRIKRSLFSRPPYQAVVEQAIAKLGTKNQNTLVFYGPPGIGKTSLWRQLATALKPRYVCAVLNGAGFKRHSKPGLEEGVRLLRNQLVRGGADLRCFDLAFAYYWAMAYPHLAFDPTGFSGRLDEADTISTGGDLIGSFASDLQRTIPYLGTATKVYWFLIKFSESLWHWYKQNGCDLQPLEDCVEPYEALELLPSYLIDGLKQYLHQHDRKVVVLVDGYDELLDETGSCTWLDSLMAAPNPYVLWVLFSEKPLKGVSLENQMPILPLTDEEVLAWMKASGIGDDQICQTLLGSVQGMPIYLSAAIDTWKQIQRRRRPRIEDFASKPQEVFAKASQAWDADEQQVFQLLSILRRWDQDLFEALMEQFQVQSWRSRLDNILDSSYIEAIEEGVWQLNRMLREQLQSHPPMDWSSEQTQAVHTWLFGYYQVVCQTHPSQLSALEEGIHHGLASNCCEEAIAWFLDQVEVQQQRDQHTAMVSMLQFLLQPEHKLAPQQTGLALMRLGRSLIELGQWEDACSTLEQAKQQWEALQLETSLETATVECDLALVYLQLGRTFDANSAGLRAYRIRVTLLGEQSLEVAEVLNRRADIADSQNNEREALALSQQALQILQAHPHTPPLQLAQAQLQTAFLIERNPHQLDQAAQLCEAALELIQAYGGDDHPLAITGHGVLGDIYQRMGQRQYQKVFTHYQQALDIAERILGPSHPQTLQLLKALARFCQKLGLQDQANVYAARTGINLERTAAATVETADSLNRLGYVFSQKGQYGQAEPLLVEALAMRKRLLGEEHPDVARSLNNLAFLYKSQGRYEAAEPLYVEALAIFEQRLGREHPDTKTVRGNLEGMRDKG